MYRLINAYGNRVVYTESEREKNRLLREGFHIEEAKPNVKTTKRGGNGGKKTNKNRA